MPEPIAPSGTPTPPAQPVQGVSQEQFNQLVNQVQQMGTFVEDASYIISGIYADPQLRTAVQSKFGGSGQPPAPAPTPTPTPPAPAPAPATPPANPATHFDPRVTDVDVKMREDIITRVEQKYGYGNLDPDNRKTLRRNVEKRLNQWNSSVLKAPVNQLTGLLEDAYLLEDMGKAKEEGRVQGLIDAHESQMGALPTMANQSLQPETTTLSPEQQKWATRWGLNQDKVTDKLKEFQDTGMVTYKPAVPSTPAAPAPSGNPTPPAPTPTSQPQNAQ